MVFVLVVAHPHCVQNFNLDGAAQGKIGCSGIWGFFVSPDW